jgi:hypothetical protein
VAAAVAAPAVAAVEPAVPIPWAPLGGY